MWLYFSSEDTLLALWKNERGKQRAVSRADEPLICNRHCAETFVTRSVGGVTSGSRRSPLMMVVAVTPLL